MTHGDRARSRAVNPARDIGVGLVAVAAVCLTAAALLARGGTVPSPDAPRVPVPATVTVPTTARDAVVAPATGQPYSVPGAAAHSPRFITPRTASSSSSTTRSAYFPGSIDPTS